MSIIKIAIALNRTSVAVNTHRKELGMRHRTKDEVSSIRKKEAASQPNPTRRLLPWSNEEVDYLKQHFQEKSTRQIAVDLHRTFKSVRKKADSLNLSKGDFIGRMKAEKQALLSRIIDSSYKPEEDQFLLANWTHMRKSDIASHLGRTLNSVVGRARVIGLIKGKISGEKVVKKRGFINPDTIARSMIATGRLPFSQQDDQFILDNWSSMTTREIALHLNRANWQGVAIRAKKIGLLAKTDDELSQIRSRGGDIGDMQVAEWIAGFDRDLTQDILKYPELIQLKKAQVILDRKLKITGNEVISD